MLTLNNQKKIEFLINFVQRLKDTPELYTLKYITQQLNTLLKDVELCEDTQLIYHFGAKYSESYDYLEESITHWKDLDQYSGIDVIKIIFPSYKEYYFVRNLESMDGYNNYEITSDFYPAKQIPVDAYYYEEIKLDA